VIRIVHRPKDAQGRDIDLDGVANLIDRVVRKWNPLGIWLFGSRARGDASHTSDWDLLIVAPDGAPDLDDPLSGWRVRKEAGVRSDVILCGATDFQEARETPNTLAFEAAHNGVLIYER